jgi:hypothetical protein
MMVFSSSSSKDRTVQAQLCSMEQFMNYITQESTPEALALANLQGIAYCNQVRAIHMNTHEKFTGIASRIEAQTSTSTSVNTVAVAMVTAQQQQMLSSRAAVASIQDSSESLAVCAQQQQASQQQA